MNKTVQLSEAQQSTIIRAAYALDPAARTLLRERVLERLEAEPEIEDGVVYRCCRSVQRELWEAPDDGYRHSPHLFRKSL